MIRTILLFTLLVGLTGAMTVWQIEIPNGKTTIALDDTWQSLHKQQTPNFSSTYNKLRKLNPWMTKNIANKTTSTSTLRKFSRRKSQKKHKWKFVGIVKKGNQRYILLLENKRLPNMP